MAIPFPLVAQALAGLLLLMAGGQLVVRGGAALARRLGVSALVIGLVIVGFGTSAPELVTGVRAALAGAPALAFGNAIGASLANLLLVLPLAALLRPFAIGRSAIRNDTVAVILAAAGLAALSFAPVPARPGGIALVLLLAGWLAIGFTREAGELAPDEAALQEREAQLVAGRQQGAPVLILMLGGGLIALVTGADRVVDAATGFARAAGIGEDVLGLTLLSFGTCLPELATAVIAVRRRQIDIVVGNVLGSCLFNLLAVAGTVQAIADAAPAGLARTLDLPALVLAAMLVAGLLLGRQRLDRASALLLMAAYGGWLLLRLLS